MANTGRWTCDKLTVYRGVRLIKDARHFPKNEKQGAATYVTFYDTTKEGTDIAIDAKIRRGADLMAALKKGDTVDVTGSVEFFENDRGQIVGKIHDASVHTLVKLKERAVQAPAAEAAPEPSEPSDDGSAVAFD
jgi:excinuclease UvrABC nuclease subunit